MARRTLGTEQANTFYNGTEKSYGDAATIGKVSGFEFLFEGDYRRQQGVNYLDQDYFLRYVADTWIAKVEFLQDGFADVRYFEASQRQEQAGCCPLTQELCRGCPSHTATIR